jgi:RNA polymerase sigma factor (sigma-70 family)
VRDRLKQAPSPRRSLRIDDRLAARLLERTDGQRFGLTPHAFAEALTASARHAFPDREPAVKELERFCASLHLADLVLATACAAGHEDAWEHFVREYRSILYRSADAIDPAGGARELADSLYADLYGLDDRRGGQRSLFRYYHGRSSLATWLRAVLAQRHVDRMRARRRVEPLDDADRQLRATTNNVPQPDCAPLLTLLAGALTRAISRLSARDRLRLALYYSQGLTLAEIGRLAGEHEATVSRHLGRTRRALRDVIDEDLRDAAGLSGAQIEEAFRCAMNDAGPIDLGEIFAAAEPRKESPR